jgi:uncharacterized protein DUF2630
VHSAARLRCDTLLSDDLDPGQRYDGVLVRSVRLTPRRRPGAEHARGVADAYRVRMDDAQIHDSIEQLVAEEHQLWGVQAAGTATDADRRRLEEVRVSLDRCWELLRQRRALEEFGMDPDAARARSDETVERYEQ